MRFIQLENVSWQKLIYTSSLVLACLSFLTMVLGPLVRAEDAGLACPDWPLCYGHVVPPYEYKIFLEFIHRVVAGVLSILFVVWLIGIFARKELRPKYGKAAVLALLLLITQILLGGATITERLNAYVVKSHLLNAVLFWSVLLFVTVKAKLNLSSSQEKSEKKSIWILGFFCLSIFFQIFLGGRVSANEAGLACPSFPACYEIKEAGGIKRAVYLPPLDDVQIERHFTHRLMGYFLSVFSVVVFLRLYKAANGYYRKWGLAIVGLVAIQILLGVLNVLLYIPVPITVLHSMTALLLYAASFVTWTRLRLV